MMRSTLTILTALTSYVLAQTPSLVELLQSQPDLTSLTNALLAVPGFAGIAATLTNITILAPIDSAFESLLAGDLTAESQAIETQDPDGISTLLAYHVINGTYNSSSFTSTPTYVNTIFNQSYAIFDTIRTNVTAGQNVGLVLNGENATVLSGELMSSNVVEADITVIPGVTIHKIDSVLTIPLNLTDTLVRLNEVGTTAALGALETANFTLRTEVDGETSLESLDTTEDLTIFVPNNDAFLAASSAFQNADLATLQRVLQYHVVTGSVVFASEIINTTIEADSGDTLTLSVIDDSVFINGARVVLPNVLLSNGVMHVIDAVLNPDTVDFDRNDIDPNASPSPEFSGATAVGTEIPFTSTGLALTSTIAIPPIATTAEFVSPTSTLSSVATFTGAAKRMDHSIFFRVLGLVAALVV